MDKIQIAYNRGYRITNEGEMINPKGGVVKGSINTSGYLQTGIRINGKRKSLPFHRIMAYQKFKTDMFKEGILVRHLDGNPINNSIDNIDIGTAHDNRMDIPKYIRQLINSKAKRIHNYKEIRKDRVLGMTYKELMFKYNISSKGTVSHIINSEMPSMV